MSEKRMAVSLTVLEI